jgi:hypothetical protein
VLVSKWTYQLVQVPVADLHVATLLVHALGEVLGCDGAVISPLLVLSSLALGVLLSLSGSAGSAAEKATDRVADRRTDGNTANAEVSLRTFNRPQEGESGYKEMTEMTEMTGIAYAAVLAICPKRPGPWEAAGAAGGIACCCGGAAMVVAGRLCCEGTGLAAGAVGRLPEDQPEPPPEERPEDRLRGIFGVCGCSDEEIGVEAADFFEIVDVLEEELGFFLRRMLVKGPFRKKSYP